MKRKKRIVRWLLILILVFISNTFVFSETGSFATEEAVVNENSILDSGTCGVNVSWVLQEDGHLIISGNGVMRDYSSSDNCWGGYRYRITRVTINEGVTEVGVNAFRQCSNLAVVNLPDGLTTIDDSAFRGCTSLETITIPDSVTSVESNAFSGCTGLKTINIPDGVTEICYETFARCTELTAITIPGNVASIETSAFKDCIKLSSVTISSGVESIGFDAFSNCTALTTIIIPDSVTSIAGRAFSNCTNLVSITLSDSITCVEEATFEKCSGLKSIEIPNGVTRIGDYSFNYCTGLTSVDIPDSVTSIQTYAFAYCKNLTSVTIPDSVSFIGDLAFFGCTNLVIYGNANSYAYEYAKDNNKVFKCISHKNLVVLPAVDSSCTKTGLTEGEKCNDCGVITVEQKEIPVKDHEEIILKGKEATCTHTGLTEGKWCEVCGTTTVEQKEISAKGHKYGCWKTVTLATCTTIGKQQRTCSVCKHVDSKTIAKLGHNYSTSWTVDKAASTSASGRKSHHCKRCDAKKDVTTIAKIKSIKLSKTTYSYNGYAKNPTVVIKNASGKTISSKNYTVTKAKGRANVGKYSYKITFKNEYKGTKNLYFKINPKATTIKTPVAAKKAFTVKWSKIGKQATGYEIMYATNSKFTTGKKTVKVTSYKTTSKKISKLKAKKTYYVKVRTYKIVNGVKYYSTWSNVKKVKTK